MTTNHEEFEPKQIQTNIEKAIISFLNKNRRRAFRSVEIMDGINFQTEFSNIFRALFSGIAIFAFPSILNNLVSRGKIKSKIIHGEFCYMAKMA